MPRVPEYQSDVSTRPIFQQELDANGSPEAFGAAVGRGMQSAARGMDMAGDAIAKVQELEDVARAKDADNSYSNWLRERMYGDNGFMTLEGRNAVDQRKSFEDEAASKRKEFGGGLTSGAARAYDTASQARLQSVYQQSIVHTAGERKAWFKDASAARVETFANDALANFSNPNAVTKNIAAGQAEIRQQGALQGWDADTLKLHESEYISGVHKNITLRMAQDDPIAAEKYISDHGKEISAADQYALKNSLKSEVIQAKSVRAAGEFFNAGQGGAGSDSAVQMIGHFEGFRSTPYWDVNHYRVGYGSDTITTESGSVLTVTPGMRVSREDAQRDLRRRVAQSQSKVISAVGREKWGALSASAKAAVTSVGYNYGNVPGSVTEAIRTGGPAEIADAIRSLGGHNGGVNNKRRNIEANAVAGGGVPSGGADFAASAEGAQKHFTDMESYLATITDPDVQAATRTRINAMLETQGKVAAEQTRAAKAELWKYIDQGKTPDQAPMEVRQAAGMEAVSSAWNYIETATKGRAVDSDEKLLYDMRRYAATNPTEFANVDLNDYRDRLSKEAIKELTGNQTTALSDQKKAREDGLNLTTAFSQAQTQLEAVGITTTGKEDTAREDAAKRIAQFQNALASQMEEFKRSNQKSPNQLEIQSMINRLLLPVVIRDTQERSMWNPLKTPWSLNSTSERDGFAFEAGQRGDNSTVDVVVKYGDIPIDLRRGISTDLERELGRKPSEDEVVHRYEDFVLNR